LITPYKIILFLRQLECLVQGNFDLSLPRNADAIGRYFPEESLVSQQTKPNRFQPTLHVQMQAAAVVQNNFQTVVLLGYHPYDFAHRLTSMKNKKSTALNCTVDFSGCLSPGG